jgi:hypothetical protein
LWEIVIDGTNMVLLQFPELQLLRNQPKSDPFFQTMSRALERFRHRVPIFQPLPLSVLVPSLSVDIAIRSLLPPKSVARALLDLYFGTFEKLHRILHVQFFNHQFEYFWKAPDTGDIRWTAMLIVVLRLGLLLRPQDGGATYGSFEWIHRMETQSLQLIELFLHFTTLDAKPTIEILQIHCLVVEARMTDGSKPYIPWKAVEILMQTGILMGLNHEPSLYPNTLSLFDAEIRRRTWTTIVELHLHVSRTSGLPFPQNGSQFTTQRPLTVNDQSIPPCIVQLPVSEHWQTITDTAFQHVLFGSLTLRLQLEATATPNTMDGKSLPRGHCIACQIRTALRPVNSPFDVHDDSGTPLFTYALQRVFLNMVAESCFLHYGLFNFSISTDHVKDLLHDSCRSILKLHQDPELDNPNRFIVARWFRNDIISAILLLCLALRAGQVGARDSIIPWKIGMQYI